MSGGLRVLCVDMGSGAGGASRSLYFSLRHMDRSRLSPVVWGRAENPLRPRYERLSIPYRGIPNLPVFRALPGLPETAIDFAHSVAVRLRQRKLLHKLAEDIGEQFGLVHFNHEGLFPTAAAWRRHLRIPFTMHMRTNCWNTAPARWAARATSSVIDHFVFITENERETFRRLGGTGEGTVIYNIADPVDDSIPKYAALAGERRFKVAVLSVYSWLKGIDRAIDIADALARQGRRNDVLFVMAGDMQVTGRAPGLLGEIARRRGTLEDYARARGVADMFVFLGHVPNPEQVLAGADMLIKPTREDNPWGRDMIEALSFGRPVLSVGRWDGFVATGKTGVLLDPFDADEAARWIGRMADDPALVAAMGRAGRERMETLCNGSARANDLANLWLSVAERGRTAA